MGWKQITSIAGQQGDFQEISCVQPKEGSAIGLEVADAFELGYHFFGHLEAEYADEMVHLTGFLVLFVDGEDFRHKLKAGGQHGRVR